MRIFVDATILEFMSIEQLQKLVMNGNTLFIKDTDLDIKELQDKGSLSPLPLEVAGHLCIDFQANRTEILRAAKARKKMHFYDFVNRGYCEEIATKSNCNGYLNSDGTVTRINK